jgi:hypothetical protein
MKLRTLYSYNLVKKNAQRLKKSEKRCFKSIKLKVLSRVPADLIDYILNILLTIIDLTKYEYYNF